jgi:hypothetical protein
MLKVAAPVGRVYMPNLSGDALKVGHQAQADKVVPSGCLPLASAVLVVLIRS